KGHSKSENSTIVRTAVPGPEIVPVALSVPHSSTSLGAAATVRAGPRSEPELRLNTETVTRTAHTVDTTAVQLNTTSHRLVATGARSFTILFTAVNRQV